MTKNPFGISYLTIILEPDNNYLQQDYWFNKTKVKVVAVAPYYIDTPLLTNDEATFPDAMDAFKSSITDNPVLE